MSFFIKFIKIVYLYPTVLCFFLFRSTAKTKSPERPALPPRPTISAPQAATGTRTEHDAIAIKKEISKPTRPPPPPKKIIGGATDTARRQTPSKPPLPPRPKSHSEVVKWWRDNEFDRGSGLDDKQKPLEWFHGICFVYFCIFLYYYNISLQLHFSTFYVSFPKKN